MELMMELNRHIPSTLYIKDTFDYMYISYTGQPTTCNGCGDLRHKIRECKKQTGTGSNAIELDSDSDSLFETNSVNSDNENSPKNDNKADPPLPGIETESTKVFTPQPSAPPLPETSTEGQDILKEGLNKVSNPQTKEPECKSSPCQNELTENQLKNHMQPHTGENANMVESLTDKPDINAKHAGEKPLPNPKEDTDKILTESTTQGYPTSH